ncbi:MAG TPA: hypothetical protein VEF35_00930 [Candidatus Bathyarchaeia archaeon]|nr:hypothetical protein [Candidatus Bathyarchaeia archaeon]
MFRRHVRACVKYWAAVHDVVKGLAAPWAIWLPAFVRNGNEEAHARINL